QQQQRQAKAAAQPFRARAIQAQESETRTSARHRPAKASEACSTPSSRTGCAWRPKCAGAWMRAPPCVQTTTTTTIITRTRTTRGAICSRVLTPRLGWWIRMALRWGWGAGVLGRLRGWSRLGRGRGGWGMVRARVRLGRVLYLSG
ncbi:hypothetical protein LTR28_000493, partial [Elasticomyces elasticus]